MTSNGLSARRKVLKRPPVCTSKPTGDCGACTLDLEIIPPTVAPGGLVVARLLLLCDPLPTAVQYSLTLRGGYTPLPIHPELTVGIQFDWPLQAPLAIGNYPLTVFAVNRDRCSLDVSEVAEVA